MGEGQWSSLVDNNSKQERPAHRVAKRVIAISRHACMQGFCVRSAQASIQVRGGDRRRVSDASQANPFHAWHHGERRDACYVFDTLKDSTQKEARAQKLLICVDVRTTADK